MNVTLLVDGALGVVAKSPTFLELNVHIYLSNCEMQGWNLCLSSIIHFGIFFLVRLSYFWMHSQ
jgi:hypothetical protein